MRASTVIRSMPTSEMRTQASITIPLSSTRSSTSIRLVPPEWRSTTMLCLPLPTPPDLRRRSAALVLTGQRGRPFAEQPFQGFDARPQGRRLRVFGRGRAAQEAVASPPVQPDLRGLVDRADQQPDANRQQLDVRQRDADIAGDDETLVQHPIENVHE